MIGANVCKLDSVTSESGPKMNSFEYGSVMRAMKDYTTISGHMGQNPAIS